METDADVEEEQREGSFALRIPRRGTAQLSGNGNARNSRCAGPQSYTAGQFGDEMKRIELKKHVVTKEPIDVETTGTGIKFDPGAELHCVGRDRKVRLDLQPRVVIGHQTQLETGHVAKAVRQARHRGYVAEVGMKSDDAESEGLSFTPGNEEGHAAGDRVNQQVRIEQIGAEKEVTMIKIQHADEIDLETEQPDVFGGQKSFQDPHDGEHWVRQIQ